MAILPLSDLVVLEFSHTVMGPSCGVVLADLGADVIRVEPAPDGDRTRRLHGFATGFFAYFNRNKRCICIDVKSPDGLAVAQDLVRKADVLIENFGPGTMDRLGLGWDAVHALNPRLIYCALKGFLPGPYEHRPSLDEIAQYMTGLAYMTGPPGQPLRAGSSVIDIMGGVMGSLAILAALRQRDKDGMGRRVTSALYESSAFLVGQHMAGEAATGTPSPPMPARSGAWGIYETFPTLNGEKLFIGITSDNHWRAFCAKFDRADLLADERFTSNADRVRNRPALREIVAAIVREHAIAIWSASWTRRIFRSRRCARRPTCSTIRSLMRSAGRWRCGCQRAMWRTCPACRSASTTRHRRCGCSRQARASTPMRSCRRWVIRWSALRRCERRMR